MDLPADPWYVAFRQDPAGFDVAAAAPLATSLLADTAEPLDLQDVRVRVVAVDGPAAVAPPDLLCRGLLGLTVRCRVDGKTMRFDRGQERRYRFRLLRRPVPPFVAGGEYSVLTVDEPAVAVLVNARGEE